MPSVRSLNKVMLIGNLTRDAEMRHTPKGTPVCGFTVATNRMWKDANGERHEDASFHRVSAWGKLGELLSNLLKKGMKVYVEASLHYSDRRDDQGKIIARQADLRAAEVVILDGNRGDNGYNNDYSSSQGNQSDDNSNDDTEELEIDDILQNMGESDDKQKKESKDKKKKDNKSEEDDLPF